MGLIRNDDHRKKLLEEYFKNWSDVNRFKLQTPTPLETQTIQDFARWLQNRTESEEENGSKSS